MPVAVLKAGETRSIQTVLEFPDMPVTFELIEGNGPVYIHGLQVPGNYELESAEGLAGEEEEEDVCIHSHFTCIDCCSTHFILIVNNIFLLFLLQ